MVLKATSNRVVSILTQHIVNCLRNSIHFMDANDLIALSVLTPSPRLFGIVNTAIVLSYRKDDY